MKLTLKVFGGFAPALLPRPRVVDTARLDASVAHRLASLVARLPGSDAAERHPDERRYELAIDDDTGCRTVCCGDTTMTPSFAEVKSLVEKHGKPP